ncbi:MAG: O-antigen ligase family protein [Candidatus Coatesbacteria bacterium]|nr:O-antigen ligase family protein [Candidatus Coatesbacteria bacterium]
MKLFNRPEHSPGTRRKRSPDVGLCACAVACLLACSGIQGCTSVSFDFLGPDKSSGEFSVLEGESRGLADGTLCIEPDPSSGKAALVLEPKDLTAEWSPIIDIGVDFSDIEHHDVRVYWRADKGEFTEEKSVQSAFNLKYLAGSDVRQRLTLNLAENPLYEGHITGLKLALTGLIKPVGIDFVRFPSSKLLSFMMPYRKWLGLDKRVFLAYLPALIVLILASLNVFSVFRSPAGKPASKLLAWAVSDRYDALTRRFLFWGLSIVFVLNAVFPFDFFPYLRFPVAGERLVYPEFLLALLVVLLASSIGPRLLKVSAAEWGFLLFLLASIISFKNAQFPNHAMSRTLFYLVPPLLFLALGRGLLNGRSRSTRTGPSVDNRLNEARRFSIVVLFAALWVAAHGVIEGIFNHNFLLDTFYRAFAPIYVEYTLSMPVASSFTDPSVLGSFIVMCFPLAVFFAVYEKSQTWLRLVGAAAVLVLAGCLVYACSYGSMVAIFAAMGIYFLRRFKRLLLGSLIAGLIAIGIAAIFVAPQYKQYLEDVKHVDELIRQGDLTQDEIVKLAGEKLDHTLLYSVNQRVDGAISALRMLRDFPLFGVGIGNFEPHFDDYYRKNPEALRIYKVPDNVVFMVLAETGIVGLMAFLLFAALVAVACVRALRATEGNRYWNGYIWAVCTGVMGFGVNCLAYDGMFWFSPSFAFWAFLAMLLPFSRSSAPAGQ